MKPFSIWLALALGVGLAGSVVTQGSCYSPAFEDCQYSCNASACPSGLFCNAAQQCTHDPQATCSGVDAATPDGLKPDGSIVDAAFCSGNFDCPVNFMCTMNMCVPIVQDGAMPDGAMPLGDAAPAHVRAVVGSGQPSAPTSGTNRTSPRSSSKNDSAERRVIRTIR